MIDKSGLKQNFIANRLGFHPSDVSHWIAGRRPFEESVCRKMAILLKCKMSDLEPGKYSDRSRYYKDDKLTIANLLDFLEVDYNSEWIIDRLESYDLGLDTSMGGRKFSKLRLKYKGVK